MYQRKVNWALTTLAACAGLWCCLSPQTTDAASTGGKTLRVTVAGLEGKPLAEVQVEFLRPGGKPYDAIQSSKDTWIIKDADNKVAVNIRSGRIIGTVELALPPNALDLVSYTITVSGGTVRAELNSGTGTPSGAPKVNLSDPGIRGSTRASFEDANRPASPGKAPAPAFSNSSVKDMAFSVPPTNDACGSAIAVSVPSVTAGTTVEATVDAGLPACTTS